MECKTYASGDKEILLGKKINGYSVIVEVVSNNRKSLHFKNMWGLDTAVYESRYKNRSTSSRPGRSSVSANDPTRAYRDTSSDPTILKNEPGVKNNSAQNSDNVSMSAEGNPTLTSGVDQNAKFLPGSELDNAQRGTQRAAEELLMVDGYGRKPA